MRWTIQRDAQKRRYPAAGRSCSRWGREAEVPVIPAPLTPAHSLCLLLSATDWAWLPRSRHCRGHQETPGRSSLSTIWKQGDFSGSDLACSFTGHYCKVLLDDSIQQWNHPPSDKIAKSRSMTNMFYPENSRALHSAFHLITISQSVVDEYVVLTLWLTPPWKSNHSLPSFFYNFHISSTSTLDKIMRELGRI